MAVSAATQSSPMDEINMTPLIDVMLVLLVMFIITIPIQTHAVKFDLPQDCPGCPDVDHLKNRIVVTNRGAVLWNGTHERCLGLQSTGDDPLGPAAGAPSPAGIRGAL